VPAHADKETARRALLDEAARIGGEGVVNLHCIESTGPGAGVTLGGHYCYGNVIKLRYAGSSGRVTLAG
jgi:nitrogenase subunit NifH